MARSSISAKEFWEVINAWKMQGQPWVLFLGARAGEYYGNDLFYHCDDEFFQTLLQHVPNFLTGTYIEKLQYCHKILDTQFYDAEIHKILTTFSNKNKYNARPEDDLLVEMVKDGLCKVIVTTSIGTYLENAFIRAGMTEDVDYKVFIPKKHSKADLERLPKYCWIIKVFGDLDSKQYKKIGAEIDPEEELELKELLEKELSKNVLVIGYDGTWDKGIEKAFPLAGEPLFYINEGALVKNSHFATVLKQRGGRYLAGKKGNYENFLKAIHNPRVIERATRKLPSVGTLPASPSPPSRRSVIISYSHRDEKYLHRLLVHLNGILHIKHPRNEAEYLIRQEDIWYDGKIEGGARWDEVIKQALESARVAIVLVSPDYFGSDYIRRTELPILTEAERVGKVRILCVILGVSLFRRTELSQYQAINKPDKPLIPMRPNEQDVIWNKLMEQVCSVLEGA